MEPIAERVSQMERFDANGRLTDENLEEQVRELAGALLAEAHSTEPVRLVA